MMSTAGKWLFAPRFNFADVLVGSIVARQCLAGHWLAAILTIVIFVGGTATVEWMILRSLKGSSQ